MRQTFMKQLALAISAALVVASTGCAKQGDPPGATLAVDMAYSYKGEQIGGAADALAPTSHGSTAADQILAYVAGQLVIQRGGRLYAFDPDADGMTPLELPDVTECYYSVMPAPDKGLTVIEMPPDADGTVMNRFYALDRQCNCIATGTIPQEVFADPLTEICCRDAEGFWYAISAQAQIRVYTETFALVKTMDLQNGGTIDRALIGHDGGVYLIVTDASGKARLYAVDRAEDRITQVSAFGTVDRALQAGNDEYPFTYHDLTGMYGIRADGTRERLIDWDASDLDATRILTPFLLDDGRVAVDRIAMSGAVSSGTEQWILTKRTKKEIQSMKILTLSVAGQQAYGLSEAISEYNMQSEDVKIVVYNYDKQDTSGGAVGITQFQKDMLDGRIADIICTDQLQTDTLLDKGVFLDLSQYLADDPAITDETYDTNFFDAFRQDGALPFLGFSYTLHTTLAKRAQFPDGTPQTAAAYLQCLSALDAGVQPFFDVQAGDILSAFCTDHLDAYVDPVNADCHFDTPEFRQLLALASQYHDDHAVWQYTDGDPNTIQRDLIAHDQVLLTQITVATPLNWHDAQFFLYRDEPTVTVGYPLEQDCVGAYFEPAYTLGIYAGSRYQDEAWDLFRYLLSEPVQRRLTASLPVCRAALKASMEDAADPQGRHSDRVFWDGEHEIASGEATAAEMEALAQEIARTTHIARPDPNIRSVIEEESGMYFYGDQSLDTTCEHIQSRVELYLSEKK